MKTIIAIIGKTSSGKDTVANYIKEQYSIPAVCSYATRAMRSGEQDGVEHYFVSKKQMKHIIKTEQVIAYTKNAKSGVEYCATVEAMSQDTMVYIINPAGLRWLEKQHPEIRLIKIYLYLDEDTIIERAILRGDSKELNFIRLYSEQEEFDDYFKQILSGEENASIVNTKSDRDVVFKQIDQILQQALPESENNNQLPYSRLEEIATNALHALVTADPEEARIYFAEELELTDNEMEYFGVSDMNVF